MYAAGLDTIFARDLAFAWVKSMPAWQAAAPMVRTVRDWFRG